MQRPVFYSGTRNASSWALRARLSLRAAGIEFEEVLVDIRYPQRLHNLAQIRRISPAGTIPLLIWEGRAIFDSLAIMEFANDACGGRLLPADLRWRAHARSLLAWQHAGLSNLMSRISFESAFYPLKRDLDDRELKEADRFFAAIEGPLAESGGPFLFGPASLADHALAPTAIKLSRHRVDARSFPHARKWMGAIVEDAHVREWTDQADRLPPIWHESYLNGCEAENLWRSPSLADVGVLDLAQAGPELNLS
ncbi:MAG: glutathione S-transferase [Alphaproteobacteria bacterium]|nr:glutathione S-transferase [Alphaproteobacteria bacterium]